MSYDVYLREVPATCPTCGKDGDRITWNPTYNLTEIFDLALTGEPLSNPTVTEAAVVLLGAQTDWPRGLRLLSGRAGADTVTWLGKALSHLEDPAREAEFRALEPENRWGTLEVARHVVRELRDAAGARPTWVWEVR